MLLDNYFVADFETVTENTNYFKEKGRTDVLFGVIKRLNCTRKWDTSYFNNITDFFKCLKMTQLNFMVVYFHNLGFDGTFILDYLDSIGFKIADNIKCINTFQVFRTTSQKIYYIKVNYEGLKIEFRCSKLLLSSSIKELGKNVNISKYENDQENNTTFYDVEPEPTLSEFMSKNKNFCLYCERDVEIARRSLIDFFMELGAILNQKNKFSEFNKLIQKTTISSVSFFFQELFLPDDIENEPYFLKSYDEKLIADKFKNGGLTLINNKYINKTFKTKKDGYVIDLKSAYPAAMSKEKLGYELVDHHKNLNLYNLKHRHQLAGDDYIFFCEATIKNIKAKGHEIPLLKNFSDNKKTPYYLEVENYHCFYEFEELMLLFELFDYDDVLFNNVYVVKKRNLFPYFVDEFYKKKEEYKKENKLAKSHIYKILLNSGYGYHCKKWDYIAVHHKEPTAPIMRLYESTDRQYLYKDNINLNKPEHICYLANNKLYAYKPINPETIKKFNNIWIANSITNNVRKKLLKAIIYFGADNVIYTDTDSIFLINVPIKKIQDYAGKNLGDWEIEKKKFDEFFIKRPKLYQLKENERTVKKGSAGFKLSEDLNKIDQTKKYDGLLVPVRVPGGLILRPLAKFIADVEKEYTIKENEIKKDEIEKIRMQINKGLEKWAKNIEQ